MKKWSFSRWRVNPAWLLLFPLLYLLPGFSKFPFPPAAGAYSDVVVAHYPYALYLKHSLTEWNTLPLWCSTILSGFPFYANPLSGLWYPPGWLALLLPLPLGFNLIAGLHLAWGGLGLYRLLRFEGAGKLPAILGGLAFASFPKFLAHYGAGHLTLIYAIAWTPWLVAAILGHVGNPGAGNRFSRLAQSAGLRDGLNQVGVVLGLILLADVRWGFYAFLLVVVVLALQPYRIQNRAKAGWAVILRPLAERGIYLSSQGALAVLLAAPLLLPLFDYARLTTRVQMTAHDVFAFSLPPARLLGLAYSDFGGFHEWVLYPGAAVVLLAAAAWVGAPNRAAVRRWTVLAGLSLVLALGSNLPPLEMLARLPGLSLLRVPPRSLFLFGLCLAALAGHGFTALEAGITQGRRRALRLVWFGWALFAGVLGFIIAVLGGRWSALWGSVAALACCFCLFRLLNIPGEKGSLRWALVVVFLLDVGVYNRSLLTFKPAGTVLGESAEAAAWLSEQPGQFRIYSPSYSLPQQTAARYGLELADGVDPLQLAGYADFMHRATGVKPAGYSVTLPPYSSGDPRKDNLHAEPDASRLGLLNVRYIAAEFDLSVAGLDLVRQFGETRIYSNQFAQDRAWVRPAGTALGEDFRKVVITKWEPNEIEVSGEGPGNLLFAELVYPGWQVFVDGQQADIQPVEDLLRSVRLEPGMHTVALRFVPIDLFIGLGLAGAGLVWILISSYGLHRSRRDRADGIS